MALNDVPQNFIMNKDKSKMLVSMDNTIDDEFININVKELSYADVARLAKCKTPAQSHKMMESIKVTTKKVNKPLRVEEELLEDSIINERFKLDIHYKKHKEFKKNEKKKRKN